MKVTSPQFILPTAILAIVLFEPTHGTDTGARVSKQELQAKIQYCSSCHGQSGQGYRGAYPMPRLAGQQAEYFEGQLQAFVERRRERHITTVMSKVHNLSPALREALALHFKDLNPKPYGGAPRDLVAMGKRIYDEGVPDKNVPACSVCHGPGAKGDGLTPRLAGQLYAYTIKELVDWNKERGQDVAKPDTSAVMEPIAHNLTRSQISAVAAYLYYLE